MTSSCRSIRSKPAKSDGTAQVLSFSRFEAHASRKRLRMIKDSSTLAALQGSPGSGSASSLEAYREKARALRRALPAWTSHIRITGASRTTTLHLIVSVIGK
jgi:hypothetical protein